MHIILLSGGSGKRLWPLSNEVRSKQFIKIFRNESELESMVQRIYRGLKTTIPEANVVVSTSITQTSGLINQLGDDVDVCVEKARRDTFPAIALGTMYLKDVLHVSDDEVVVVCPVDPYVENDYFETIKKLGEEAATGSQNITLMGIQPTYPSEKYGYIVTDGHDRVISFKEKPDLETARRLVSEGALWNGGVFAFKLGYLVNKAHEMIDFTDFADLKENYDKAEKISFDYAVVEKEKDLKVVPFDGKWKDLGTWNTLTEAMENNVVGEAILDETCEGTHVINETDVTVLGMGLKNIVVAVSPDGILVSDKERSSYMKPFVDSIVSPIKFAEKSWGSYKVLDVGKNSLLVKVVLNEGHSMNYHSHSRRRECWNVTEGEGIVVIDGVKRTVGPGDVVEIPTGCKHTVKAVTALKIIEVQTGEDIDVKDKEKHNLDVSL